MVRRWTSRVLVAKRKLDANTSCERRWGVDDVDPTAEGNCAALDKREAEPHSGAKWISPIAVCGGEERIEHPLA
jgi:hypothetical protein